MKKRIIPALVAVLTVALGLTYPSLKNRLFPKRPIYALMYHHVVEDGQPCNDMTVTVGRLKKDLIWLEAHGYETVLPRDLAEGNKLPAKPVLITFDDGYRSNYELLFPALQEAGMKAAISLITSMPEEGSASFLSWEMCREMTASGLVEIGSHSHALHNLSTMGIIVPGGVNGIQRVPDESDESFRIRVLDDLQRSYDLIAENAGAAPTFLAFPFGLTEPDADELVNRLFPVTFVTGNTTSVVRRNYHCLARLTVTMGHGLNELLPE